MHPTPVVDTANRYNLFRRVHKALRARLADALVLVGQHDHGPLTEVIAFRISQLLDACRLHLEHENTFIHPVIGRLSPGACRHVQEEHEQHLASMQELRVLLQKIQIGKAVMTQLYDSLAMFVADNLQHMDYEEQVLNAVLWQLMTDEQIAAIEREWVGSMTPEQARDSLEWMLPHINPQERTQLMLKLQQTADAEFYSTCHAS